MEWGSASDKVTYLEALHRDTHICGQQGHIFDPMRFHPTRLSHEQRRAFISRLRTAVVHRPRSGTSVRSHCGCLHIKGRRRALGKISIT